MDADFDAARMRESLRLAARAAKRGEVPVGALVVKDGKVTEQEALSKATNPQALEMNFKGIFLDEGRRILT